MNPYDNKYMYDAVDEYDVDDGDDKIYLFEDDSNFVALLMDFIKLSIPHLEYSILNVTNTSKEKLPKFNDLGNDGKKYDIGYMFEFKNCYIFNK